MGWSDPDIKQAFFSGWLAACLFIVIAMLILGISMVIGPSI